MAARVVVFLDWQNVYRGARRAFHSAGDPHWCGQVDPVALARHVATDSPWERELAQVRIYRGLPDRRRDPRGFVAARRQAAAWRESPLVDVTFRALRYPPGGPPQEKGIDVALALDFALMAVYGDYDVGILMSTDTDLIPALEFVGRLTDEGGPRADLAGWSPSGKQGRRLSTPGPRRLYTHWVDDAAYAGLVDPTNYSR